MPFAKHKIRQGACQLLDSVAACLAWLAAVGARAYLPQSLFFVQLPDTTLSLEYLYLLIPVAILTPLIHAKIGFYNLGATRRRGDILNLCVQTATWVFICIVFTLFLGRINFLARSVCLIFIPFCSLFLYLRHQIVSQIILRHIPQRRQNLLLVTDRQPLTNWEQELNDHPEFELRLIRQVHVAEIDNAGFVRCLHNDAIHLVIFDVKHTSFHDISQLIQASEEEGVETWLATNLFETSVARVKVDYFLNHPMLIFRSTPDNSWEILCKSIMDRVGALLLLAAGSLPMLLISVLIKLTDRGPVFFKQQRSGLHGRPFIMYKFRSMVANAEQLKSELDRHNEMTGPVFKVTNDPRVTPLGRFLRKTSLDELPQFINVLKGEMSLVGPRPLPVYETLAISENTQRRRLSVKPGITCLWQIQGRNEVKAFADWVNLDLQYIDHWSIWLDLKILCKTIPAVLRFHGAK
ncbi:MAG: sugar transferase [Verrucomicrobiales bacterium]|jgi:exopolysaccharide biosynthesis polyprenyl glycosylphosphotransferase|nr:sugar transferase [Verrucomicrobiales bacterium]